MKSIVGWVKPPAENRFTINKIGKIEIDSVGH